MVAKRPRIVGRRKTSVARVYMTPGEGNIVVNKKPLDEYFGRETLKMIARQPFEEIEAAAQFDFLVNVKGGGSSGQAGAVRHGIARALSNEDPEYRGPLKKAGYLRRDEREVERKKYGRHKARKRPQFSKR